MWVTYRLAAPSSSNTAEAMMASKMRSMDLYAVLKVHPARHPGVWDVGRSPSKRHRTQRAASNPTPNRFGSFLSGPRPRAPHLPSNCRLPDRQDRASGFEVPRAAWDDGPSRPLLRWPNVAACVRPMRLTPERSPMHSPPCFEDQVAADKTRLEAQVAKLPAGRKKDQLLKKIRQLETASHISDWLSSPELNRLTSA